MNIIHIPELCLIESAYTFLLHQKLIHLSK